MKFSALLFSLLCISIVLAKTKGRGSRTDENVVNPDPDAGKSGQTPPQYNNEMFEGDMIPEDENSKVLAIRRYLWPQATVPYKLDGTISTNMKSKIEQAIADFAEYTCVDFVPRTDERDYVSITTKPEGCYAERGMIKGKQPLNLEDPDCGEKGTVIHEMMHTIGIGHEQNRDDRNDYVTIRYEKIDPQSSIHFSRNINYQTGLGYDYSSVMHYHQNAFASDERIPSIFTKDPSKQTKIGQRAGFSKQDIKQVNKLYKCNGKDSHVGGNDLLD